MSLSAAASRLAPNPQAEALSERGHALQQRGPGGSPPSAEAQLAVGSGKYPELGGNVATVETRDFWRLPEVSPRDQGFHYNQNAETYYLVGEALGRGMVALLEGLGSR